MSFELLPPVLPLAKRSYDICQLEAKTYADYPIRTSDLCMTLCDKVQVQRLTPWPNRLLVEANSNFCVYNYQRRKVVLLPVFCPV
jgi:hypothetical protein